MSKIIKAIKAINPNANVSVGNDSLDEITWVEGTTPISKTDIQNKIVELDKLNYQEHRVGTATTSGYISIQDQLDQLYHDMKDGKLGAAATTGSWYVGITSVKTLYPKP